MYYLHYSLNKDDNYELYATFINFYDKFDPVVPPS